MDKAAVIESTRRWIASMVIGLNLCPYARRVFQEDKIRYSVTDAVEESALLAGLTAELKELAASPLEVVETTLLIHPHALLDFLDYNDFLGTADELLGRLKLHGTIQIASFHPAYQFAGSAPTAVENYTNRSPYPMLHLLREASVSKVAGDEAELRAIPRRNVETLRALGLKNVLGRLKTLEGPSAGS